MREHVTSPGPVIQTVTFCKGLKITINRSINHSRQGGQLKNKNFN